MRAYVTSAIVRAPPLSFGHVFFFLLFHCSLLRCNSSRTFLLRNFRCIFHRCSTVLFYHLQVGGQQLNVISMRMYNFNSFKFFDLNYQLCYIWWFFLLFFICITSSWVFGFELSNNIRSVWLNRDVDQLVIASIIFTGRYVNYSEPIKSAQFVGH